MVGGAAAAAASSGVELRLGLQLVEDEVGTGLGGTAPNGTRGGAGICARRWDREGMEELLDFSTGVSFNNGDSGHR